MHFFKSSQMNYTYRCGQRLTRFIVMMTEQSHKSHNALVPYPTMHHSERKCAHFCSEWCILGYGERCIVGFVRCVYCDVIHVSTVPPVGSMIWSSPVAIPRRNVLYTVHRYVAPSNPSVSRTFAK